MADIFKLLWVWSVICCTMPLVLADSGKTELRFYGFLYNAESALRYDNALADTTAQPFMQLNGSLSAWCTSLLKSVEGIQHVERCVVEYYKNNDGYTEVLMSATISSDALRGKCLFYKHMDEIVRAAEAYTAGYSLKNIADVYVPTKSPPRTYRVYIETKIADANGDIREFDRTYISGQGERKLKEQIYEYVDQVIGYKVNSVYVEEVAPLDRKLSANLRLDIYRWVSPRKHKGMCLNYWATKSIKILLEHPYSPPSGDIAFKETTIRG